MLDDHGPALEHLDWAPYLAEGGPWPFVHAIVQNGPYTLDEMLDWCPLIRPDMVFCLVWHLVRLTDDGQDRASELRGRLDALANPTMW